jgi:hypothetical protein
MTRLTDRFRHKQRLALLTLLLIAPCVPLEAAGHAQRPDKPPSAAEIARTLGGSAESPDAPMLGGGQPIAVPFRLEDGHILVEASVDGHPPKPFVFDSGGRNTIAPDAARDLNLRPGDDGTLLGGVGPGRLAAKIVSVPSIAIGAADLENQSAFIADLPNSLLDRGSQPRAAGLIGSELLQKYVVRIDYRNLQLTLIPASQFQPPADALSLPLTMSMSKDGLTRATVPADIDHVPGQFIVDTGNGGQIYLASDFEGTHELVSHYKSQISVMSPGGVGGNLRVRMGLGESFTLGTAAFSVPLVNTPADARVPSHVWQRGVLGAGLLGNGVLSHFIVTLDYRAYRIYLESPARMRLTTALFGTGIFVDKPEHEAFKIIDVLPQSAAEHAGLRRGDRIVEADGHPARDLSLSDFHSLNGVPVRKELAVETEDGRRFILAITQILP